MRGPTTIIAHACGPLPVLVQTHAAIRRAEAKRTLPPAAVGGVFRTSPFGGIFVLARSVPGCPYGKCKNHALRCRNRSDILTGPDVTMSAQPALSSGGSWLARRTDVFCKRRRAACSSCFCHGLRSSCCCGVRCARVGSNITTRAARFGHIWDHLGKNACGM